jgi:hypothetical protein
MMIHAYLLQEPLDILGETKFDQSSNPYLFDVRNHMNKILFRAIEITKIASISSESMR